MTVEVFEKMLTSVLGEYFDDICNRHDEYLCIYQLLVIFSGIEVTFDEHNSPDISQLKKHKKRKKCEHKDQLLLWFLWASFD